MCFDPTPYLNLTLSPAAVEELIDASPAYTEPDYTLQATSAFQNIIDQLDPACADMLYTGDLDEDGFPEFSDEYNVLLGHLIQYFQSF